MDQWFMESYLRWLGQASDAELIDRKDAVAIALLQAGIDSELSRVLFDLIIEEVDARDQIARMRRVRRQRAAAEPKVGSKVAPMEGTKVVAKVGSIARSRLRSKAGAEGRACGALKSEVPQVPAGGKK